ncbi:MAG TPA: hypothetical protein DCL44_01090 [Elusimicrobia bacterium]|nr:hypothetical protein [Elusimicrobiota bacterium]
MGGGGHGWPLLLSRGTPPILFGLAGGLARNIREDYAQKKRSFIEEKKENETHSFCTEGS